MILSTIRERFFVYALSSVVLLGLSVSVIAKSDSKNKTKKSSQKTVLKASLAQTHYDSKQTLQTLPKSVTKLLKKYKIPKRNISIYIRDLNAKSPLLVHNADKLRVPASTMKLLSTYAALKELGASYSWRTEVWLRGKLEDGVLDGDLIIKGFGDPFLVQEKFWKLIKTLRDKGLQQINGDIIIDNSYFQLEKHDPAAFDGKAYRAYNAQSSALMFNFQATRFLFTPDEGKAPKPEKIKNKKSKRVKTKGSVKVVPYPSIDDFTFVNQIKLTKGRCRKSHRRPKFSKNSNGKFVIKGKYSLKCKQRYILRAVSSPEHHVFNAFRDFWRDSQGTLKGGLKLGKVNAGDEIFHVYSSPSLGEQIRLINKWSNNVMAKQLLLTLGAKKFGAPATMDKGRRAVIEVLDKSSINTKSIRLENGSGLSRTARISAKQMGKLLETAFRESFMPEFIASMSLLGVDGTLGNRLHKKSLRGRSHLKSGTIDFATAVAGYMLNRQGKRFGCCNSA